MVRVRVRVRVRAGLVECLIERIAERFARQKFGQAGFTRQVAIESAEDDLTCGRAGRK